MDLFKALGWQHMLCYRRTSQDKMDEVYMWFIHYLKRLIYVEIHNHKFYNCYI